MNESIASARGAVPKALLLLAFAVVLFLSGRLWSLRAVWEARRAAGVAERERLALQAELTECRNALLLQRQRAAVPSGGLPEVRGTGASRGRTPGHALTPGRPAVGP